MEGKTVLTACVTGTVFPKDGKDPEVSYWYFVNLNICLTSLIRRKAMNSHKAF